MSKGKRVVNPDEAMTSEQLRAALAAGVFEAFEEKGAKWGKRLAPDPKEADIQVPSTLPVEAQSPGSQATEEFNVISPVHPDDLPKQHTIGVVDNPSVLTNRISRMFESRLQDYELRIKKMLEDSDARMAQQIAIAAEKMGEFDFRLRQIFSDLNKQIRDKVKSTNDHLEELEQRQMALLKIFEHEAVLESKRGKTLQKIMDKKKI
ncbi:hypothetical protein Droror1_Dr00016558 [Drosera rotundifolia]